MVKPHHTRGWNSANRRNEKRKRRITLNVASALILLLTYVCKEVLVGELKEVTDSLQTAQSKIDTQRSEGTISFQIMNLREQMELNQAKDERASQDYSATILQDSLLARQALDILNVDFENVSQLVDKLAFVDVNGDLRRMRDQQREQVAKANKDVNEALMPSTKHDIGRMGRVKVALIEPLVYELPVVILGSSAMTTAKRVQDLIEKVRRFLTRLSYVFYVIGVGLALYANLSGGKAIQE
jgi:hypothetical protein